MNKFEQIIWIAVLLLCGQAANSQTHVIRGPERQSLTDRLLILPAASPGIPAGEIADQPGFVPIDQWDEPVRGQEDYWLKLTLHNEMEEGKYREWVLQLSQSLSRVLVYRPRADSLAYPLTTGFFVPIAERDFTPTYKANVIRFELPPGQQETLLIKARSDRASIPPTFDLTLEADQQYFARLQVKKQISALFIGFCLMMLIYTLILFIYNRDKTYSHYAAYLIAIGIYVAYVNGNIHELLIPALMAEKPQYIYLFKLVTYPALISYMSFFRNFLDLSQLLPNWDRFFRWLTLAAVPVMLLDLTILLSTNFSYLLADRVTISYSLIFVLASLFFTIVLYRTHDKKGYFVVVGLACMGLGVLATALYRLYTVDYSVLYFEIGATFELVVFSLGLAYRQQVIRRERERAQFELEKSQLIQRQEHAEMERQRAMNKLKSELYTNITHELRTPLTVIKGMTEQIADHEWEKELIERNIESLLRLVNQVMDLSQLEAGRMELKPKQSDIIPFLRYLSESFQSNAAAKQLRLSFSTDLPKLIMDFDGEKMQQVIYNLLSNALKFTPDEGIIEFRAYMAANATGEKLVLEVNDTGRGIAEEELPFIFDRFFQSQLYYHQQYGGSGIGLALTQQLVHLMGGEISVSSILEKGTSFRIVLPISRDAPPEEKVLRPAASQNQTVATADGVSGETRDLPLVLVIEDNRDVIRYIESCLPHYRIETAFGGKQGLKKAFELVPDIIISDVMMPEMNGFELCEMLKNDIRSSHVPVILLTARSDQEGKLAGLKSGADAYLTKPFDKRELLIRMHQLTELRATLQQHFLRSSLLQQVHMLNPSDPEAEFLQKLRQHVFDEIDNPDLSVKDLTKTVHLGHTQLYRKLKAITGLTPVRFINNIRLERAVQLLVREPEPSIAEIAYAVGYNDPNYFSRAFQQHYGYPPTEYKDRVKKAEQ